MSLHFEAGSFDLNCTYVSVCQACHQALGDNKACSWAPLSCFKSLHFLARLSVCMSIKALSFGSRVFFSISRVQQPARASGRKSFGGRHITRTIISYVSHLQIYAFSFLLSSIHLLFHIFILQALWLAGSNE